MTPKRTTLMFVATCVLLLDQSSKAVARSWPQGEGIVLVPGLVRLVHAENPGAVLGWLTELPGSVRLAIFVAAAAGLTAVAWRWFRRLPVHARLAPAGLGLVVAGGAGNTLDRLLTGHVTDMLVLGEAVPGLLTVLSWVGVHGVPAFNLADVALGAGLMTLATSIVVAALRPPEPP